MTAGSSRNSRRRWQKRKPNPPKPNKQIETKLTVLRSANIRANRASYRNDKDVGDTDDGHDDDHDALRSQPTLRPPTQTAPVTRRIPPRRCRNAKGKAMYAPWLLWLPFARQSQFSGSWSLAAPRSSCICSAQGRVKNDLLVVHLRSPHARPIPPKKVKQNSLCAHFHFMISHLRFCSHRAPQASGQILGGRRFHPEPCPPVP